MSKPKNVMKGWVAVASIDERKRLAELAASTPEQLMQVAGAYRNNGTPNALPEAAKRWEEASIELHASNSKLPVMRREDLCLACGNCDLAKQARNVKGVK